MVLILKLYTLIRVEKLFLLMIVHQTVYRFPLSINTYKFIIALSVPNPASNHLTCMCYLAISMTNSIMAKPLSLY